MPLTDLPLDQLETYRSSVEKPEDLESFWTDTINEARSLDLDLHVRPVENKLALIDTYDINYAGFGGTPIRAWLHTPAGATGPLPTMVQYHGYSRGRGFPHTNTIWAQAGYAQLMMDTRAQGWAVGGPGGTADFTAEAGLAHSPGYLTAGLRDPSTYYYRRVYTDALRLLDVVDALQITDSDRTIATGISQGGGLTIAVAGLAALAGLPLLGAAPDVPFLCDFARGVAVATDGPYPEITRYLAGWRDHAESAYRTLSYFDAVNLGAWASAPALFSVALMDDICPPSTVYGAFHAYGETQQNQPQKSIVVYGHNAHEGGQDYQVDAQLDWFAQLLS